MSEPYEFERSNPPVWWEAYDVDSIFDTKQTSLWDWIK